MLHERDFHQYLTSQQTILQTLLLFDLLPIIILHGLHSDEEQQSPIHLIDL